MAGNATFILASQAGALAIAAVLSSLYPVVTVLLAIVVLREHVTRSHVAGIALTVARDRAHRRRAPRRLRGG